MRDIGWYWVRFNGYWVEAYWNGAHFIVTPDNIDEIDERRIERSEVSQ